MINTNLKTFENLNYYLKNNHDNIIDFEEYEKIIYENLNKDNKMFVDIFNKSYENKLKFYSITNNRLNLMRGMTLYDFLIVMNNITSSKEIENGYLLDSSKSFMLPSLDQIGFNLNNNIKSERTFEYLENVSYWNISNILVRRLYNISPKIDLEYSEAAIYPFSLLLQNVILDDPYTLFKVFIIDPRIIFSIIRNSEIEAYKTIATKFINKKIPTVYIHKLGFDALSHLFKQVFNRKCEYLKYLYNKYYIQYFVYNQPQTSYYYNNQIQDNYTIQTIKAQIYNTILDGDHKSYINLYVDEDSLKILDQNPDDNGRILTYKLLFYYIYQLRLNRPELLNRNKKFIFSKSFYLNNEIFALYNKYENKYFVTREDLSLNEFSPKQAIEYIKNIYNVNIVLDANEVNGAIISEKAIERDLEILTKGMNL